MDLKAKIREVQDFPSKGISFKDITTLFQDPEALRYTVHEMAERYRAKGVELIVGVESRGFLVGAPLAYEMEAGFVLVRKPGKLPCEVERVEYSLEYGTDAIEMHKDSIKPGQKVLLVDDLLATGGTIEATVELVERLGGEIVGIAFLIELSFLGGRERLKNYDVFSLVRY